MIKWILQDTKRILKSHKTYLLLLVILFTMVKYVSDFDSQQRGSFTTSSNVDFITHYDQNEFTQDFEGLRLLVEQTCYSKYNDYIGMYDNCDEFNYFSDLMHSISDDVSDKQYYETRLFLLDIYTDNFIRYYNSLDSYMQDKLNDYAINLDVVMAVKEEIKREISPTFEPLDLEYRIEDAAVFNLNAMNLLETHTNYKNGYPRDAKYLMTSSIFIANYLNDYFLLLVVSSILLIFDSIYRDYKLGVIKNIMSSPMKRYTYMITKTVSSFIGLGVIIFIPLALISIGLYVYHGYNTANYPILVGRTTFSSFTPERKYLKIMLTFGGDGVDPDYSTYRTICELAPVSKFAIDIPSDQAGLSYSDCRLFMPSAMMSMMPLSKYILITLLYFVLIILFISSLNTLMSLIFNNQIYNLIALMGLLGISLILNNVFFGKEFMKFFPFIFMSPTSLMMQTIPYTFLNGVTTLTLWTLIINFINLKLIKMKDFTY